MKRRPIQIVACGVDDTRTTQCEAFLFALADDGTMWFTDNRTRFSEWSSVTSLPEAPDA